MTDQVCAHTYSYHISSGALCFYALSRSRSRSRGVAATPPTPHELHGSLFLTHKGGGVAPHPIKFIKLKGIRGSQPLRHPAGISYHGYARILRGIRGTDFHDCAMNLKQAKRTPETWHVVLNLARTPHAKAKNFCNGGAAFSTHGTTCSRSC